MDKTSAFDLARNIALVPPFQEKEVDKHFEEAILKAYEVVPKAYRQKFRNYLNYDSKIDVEFVREKENLFHRWCHSKEVGQDFES